MGGQTDRQANHLLTVSNIWLVYRRWGLGNQAFFATIYGFVQCFHDINSKTQRNFRIKWNHPFCRGWSLAPFFLPFLLLINADFQSQLILLENVYFNAESVHCSAIPEMARQAFTHLEDASRLSTNCKYPGRGSNTLDTKNRENGQVKW